MRVLTVNNTSFDINEVPDQIDEIKYSVLDYSHPDNVDYFFVPLVFLESYSSPAADLQIGPYRIQMPLDWCVVIGDKEFGDLEIIQLMHLNDRDFSVFSFNPIKGYMPKFFKIDIVDIYPDVKWFIPKLKYGHILSVPLTDEENPFCVFFVKDVNKLPDVLDISKLV
jgi:hypothetical protein